jgi:transposase-like protein
MLKGIVEVDETFVGGKFDPRRKRPRWKKPPVIGLIERGGRVQAALIPSRSAQVLVGTVRDRVAPNTRVITDELPSYNRLGKLYDHDVITHAREYVRGDIYTNTVENFWSLLKRGIIGSFHKVSVKHLPRYLAEFTCRFNNRQNPEMFSTVLKSILSRNPLPYEKLIAKV